VVRTGSVVSLINEHARIQLDNMDCSRCEKGQGCAIRLFSSQVQTLPKAHVNCANHLQAQAGDQVEVLLDVPQSHQLRVYAAYGLPLLGLLVGAILGTVLGQQMSTDSQLFPSLLAIIGFAVGVIAYPTYNCSQHTADLQGLNPRISRVLDGESTLTFRAKTSAEG